MEQSQSRVMILLATVLIAVVCALWLWEPGEEEADPDATRPVWAVEADEIVRVELTRADGGLVLAKSGQDWRLESPVAVEADTEQVGELLDALAKVRRGVPIDRSSNLEEYGVGEPPRVRVVVSTEAGATATLVVGDAAPVGFRTYMLDEVGQVVAVNGDPGEVLTRPASEFRDHRVFTFDPAAVRAVRIEGPEGALSARGQGKAWWLEGFSRADPDKVDDLVVGLLDLRFDAFTDEIVLSDRPAFTVTVEQEGAPPQRLFVGGQLPMGTAVWTEAGRRGVAYTDSLALLMQGPTDLGDLRAFPLDLESVDQVAITRGPDRWEAARTGGAWTVGGAASADAAVVVDRLAAATIHYRRDPVPPITTPWATVELTDQGAIYVVDLGQELDGGFRVAKDRAGGEPYLVPAHELDVIASLK